MNTMLKIIAASLCLLFVHTLDIRVEVYIYVQKTGSDSGGPNLGLITTIRESGNGQFESITESRSVDWESGFVGNSKHIASADFSGILLPQIISVNVYENHGSSDADRGICSISTNTPFSKTPTIIGCFREENGGRSICNVIFVVIRQI